MNHAERPDDKQLRSRTARRVAFGRWASRLTDEEMNIIYAAAKMNHKTIADYVHDLVVADARAVLKRIRDGRGAGKR
jgi:uncharacterized protein (DUF1778 family)